MPPPTESAIGIIDFNVVFYITTLFFYCHLTMMVIVPIEILLFIAVIRNHVSGSLLGLAIRTREGE